MYSGPLIIAIYFPIFALTHSLPAGTTAKSLARRALGPGADRWYRLAYVALSSAAVLPFLYALAFHPGRTLYLIPGPWSWIMLAGQATAALSALGALWQTGIFQFLGLEQAFAKGRPYSNSKSLITGGFFCHLRNPLFLAGIIFLWLSPLMTESLLTFNLLATAYFYLGALHEERSLRAEFGQEYENYRRRVPMFMPRLRCRP